MIRRVTFVRWDAEELEGLFDKVLDHQIANAATMRRTAGGVEDLVWQMDHPNPTASGLHGKPLCDHTARSALLLFGYRELA
jgi:hypothetical protein